MNGDTSEPEVSGSERSSLLQETQRVLGEQVKIVQEQQAQATRIIRVALTVGGLLLTGISIFVSSPLFPSGNGEIIPDIKPTFLAVSALLSIYLLLFLLIIFGKIFASALIVLSPETGGISVLVNNPFATLLSFYRQHFLPQPLSDFLIVHQTEIEGGMSLRPGVDGEEIQNILREEDSEDEIVERVIAYNSGSIQGNEQLIEDNRERLSEIYGIGVFAILIISVAVVMGFSFAIIVLL